MGSSYHPSSRAWFRQPDSVIAKMHRTLRTISGGKSKIAFGYGGYAVRATIVPPCDHAHPKEGPSGNNTLEGLRPCIHDIHNACGIDASAELAHLAPNIKRRAGYYHKLRFRFRTFRLKCPFLGKAPMAPQPFETNIAPISGNMDVSQPECRLRRKKFTPRLFGVAPVLGPQNDIMAGGGKRLRHEPIALGPVPFGRQIVERINYPDCHAEALDARYMPMRARGLSRPIMRHSSSVSPMRFCRRSIIAAMGVVAPTRHLSAGFQRSPSGSRRALFPHTS